MDFKEGYARDFSGPVSGFGQNWKKCRGTGRVKQKPLKTEI